MRLDTPSRSADRNQHIYLVTLIFSTENRLNYVVITEPMGVPQGGHSGADISAVLAICATPGGSTRSCGRELSRDVPGVARVGRQGGPGGAGVGGVGGGGYPMGVLRG